MGDTKLILNFVIDNSASMKGDKITKLKNALQKFDDKINSLSFTKKDAREFTRFFLSGATVAEFDSQGRVNITSPQLSYADIEKECVVVGVGNRLEIWAIENWNTFMDSAFKNMSDIAENLFNERVIE